MLNSLALIALERFSITWLRYQAPTPANCVNAPVAPYCAPLRNVFCPSSSLSPAWLCLSSPASAVLSTSVSWARPQPPHQPQTSCRTWALKYYTTTTTREITLTAWTQQQPPRLRIFLTYLRRISFPERRRVKQRLSRLRLNHPTIRRLEMKKLKRTGLRLSTPSLRRKILWTRQAMESSWKV